MDSAHITVEIFDARQHQRRVEALKMLGRRIAVVATVPADHIYCDLTDARIDSAEQGYLLFTCFPVHTRFPNAEREGVRFYSHTYQIAGDIAQIVSGSVEDYAQALVNCYRSDCTRRTPQRIPHDTESKPDPQ